MPQLQHSKYEGRSTKSEVRGDGVGAVLRTSDFVLDVAKRPVLLRTGIGSAHDTVATTSKPAQAFYDQGLAYLHSYVWLEAARSFNEALRLDPTLAMAHLGLTIAYTELHAAAAAHAALERAVALATT